MIARFIKLLSVCVLTITFSFGQTFEGKIIYENIYKSKIPNLSDQQFTLMMGATQEYLIKGGNYKSATNGTFLQWQLYINKDNKLYSKMSNSASILWNDGSVNPDEVLTAVVNKNVIDILGQPCDELVLTCKSGVQKYYFSGKLKVDPKQYENHKFGNWSDVMSRTNSLPLKIIIDNPQFTVEAVATQIEPMGLDDKQFQLPPDSQVEKSPY